MSVGYKCFEMSNMCKQECYCLCIYVEKRINCINYINCIVCQKRIPLSRKDMETCFFQRILFIVLLPGDLVTTPHFIL